MTAQQINGVINSGIVGRRTDYLFRLSLKALIIDDQGRVLLVKEAGRDWWDLPGGGLDHGESIAEGLARELAEEVNLRGDFSFEPIHIEDPKLLKHINAYQARVFVRLCPENMNFSPGDDGDEVAFLDVTKMSDEQVHARKEIIKFVKKRERLTDG